MSNLGTLLKDQITRIARREMREPLEQLKKASTSYRREIAALKKQVAALEKQLASAARGGRKAPAVAAEKPAKVRFSPQGLIKLRDRLGLSQSDFGSLAGVSSQAVFNWEHGTAVPRQPQLEALAELRGIGKREALERLKASGRTPTKPRRRRNG
ncbi:MAG TPA: helix-turn-helix domain-containing protein [Arenimonas sp.]|nr:helix-turn-helix domain-containing protein [Arenimonas sp.]